MYLTQFQEESIDLKNLKKEQIRAGFIVNLPFRLRTGRTFRINVDISSPCEVIFRNNIEIPQNTDHMEWLGSLRGDWSKFCTRVLIIIDKPRIEESEIEQLKSGDNVGLTRNQFEALQALNHAILAYSNGTKELFGGPALYLFSDRDFYECSEWEITLLLPEKELLNEDGIEKLFNLRPEKKITKSFAMAEGHFTDLGKEELSNIKRSLILQKDFIFYEFAFQAKSKMLHRDFIGALLAAVIALEGAHAAFLRKVLSEKLNEYDDKNKLITDYLREQGLYTLIQISPFLFMDKQEMPNLEDLKECIKGIAMRNSVMHALTDKTGYKMKKYKNNKISEAYSSVLKVYDCFVKALEKRL